jgi:very-short-patch-repair endonuclease
MINRSQLLKELQGLLRRMEADLLERSQLDTLPEVQASLRSEYEQAKQSERTALSYEEWRSDYAMHIGAAWILSGVFVRFLEDNELIDPPIIAGQTLIPNPSPQGEGSQTLIPSPSPQGEGSRILPLPLPGEREAGRVRADRLQRSRDEYEQYFRSHPTETDREYLLSGFRKLAKLSGGAEIFGQHNPVYEVPTWLSGDAAGELLKFFQQIDPATGKLVHDFTDANWDTRFLGDLYQDLSERARKKYALLQTPQFVEQFILERTLEPAIEEFGLAGFRMIDPACGSGHFLLGSFQRLMERWYRQDPSEKYAVLAQRALDSVHGVDINPFAVAIARFRLLLAAMKEAGITGLRNAPDFKIHLACGDSLLHGEGTQLQLAGVEPLKQHHYRSEDVEQLNQILIRGHYNAVVANPPYITPKDSAANSDYRKRYKTCHMKYSLAVPFMERIFQLAINKGFTGQITANSFMKREFGKKLIEEFFPTVDLTHVIDTSGAYIPGHGTPTVILLGRNRKYIGDTIRTVMGIKGEPSTPDDPAQGKVWSAVLNQVDLPGSQSEFVSVADSARDAFHQHPWSIGGGGASELKEQLDQISTSQVGEIIESIGFMAISGEDDIFVTDGCAAKRFRIPVRTFCPGDVLRDWQNSAIQVAALPYDFSSSKVASWEPERVPELMRYLWAYRINLRSRNMFGKSIEEYGFRWFEYIQFIRERATAQLSIAFAFVATHNHFVLDRGGKVFKQSAPVIKLPANATEDDHLALLGLLNSSTGAFWMRQVFHDKGGGGIGGGIAAETWERFFEYDGTKIKAFPLPTNFPGEQARCLDAIAHQWNSLLPHSVLLNKANSVTSEFLQSKKQTAEKVRNEMISLQEELDWQCYRLYGLITEDLTYVANISPHPPTPSPQGEGEPDLAPPSPWGEGGWEGEGLALGQRAFEIVMARKIAAGELETTWFERHNSTPITELPDHWSDDYKRLVERRIEIIETNKNISLIEQPEYKRRWNTEPWDSQLERALQSWLLDRLETYFDFDGRMHPHPPTPSPQGEGEPDLAPPSPQGEGGREGEGISQPDPHPQPFSLGRREPDLDPPSPWGEGGWEGEGISKLAGQLRQIPKALLQRARELRQKQTPAEQILWECLRDRRLADAKFRRQHNLGQYIADFYCHAAQLVIELDGAIHQTQQMRDSDRDQWMQTNGFTVLRFSNEDIFVNLEQVLSAIVEQIQPSDPHPPAPSPQGEGENDLTLAPPSPWGEGGWEGEGIPIAILSTAKLADLAQQDPDFMQVGALYRHSDTFHLQTLIDELVEAESVPLLPILRYKPSGLRKRAAWEQTWTLQRQEDAIDARTQLPNHHPDHLTLLQAKDLKTREVGTIPVPPKYTSADFLSHHWRLRGKLDVPKERWVSFPYCEGNDGKLAIAWAGYDHLQLTQALSNYYIDIKENLGGSEDPRLIPILACLLELLPWLKQWHGAIDPTYGYAMSDYFEDFIQEEARYFNQTLDQIRAWEPPKRTTRRR